MQLALAQTILHNAKMCYALVNRDLHILECGGGYAFLMNGQALPSGQQLLSVLPELAGNEASLLDVLEGRIPRLYIQHLERALPDHQMLYLSLTVLPYRLEDGQPAIVVVVNDTTEQGRSLQEIAQQHNELRLLQEQLVSQNEALMAANLELQRLDDIKTTFTSVAAHELRTPLTSIIGYVDMLLDSACGPLLPEQRASLETINKSARRLQAITADLLDVVRIDADRITLVLQPVDIVFLVSAIVAEYQPQFDERQQHYTLDADDTLPLIVCDEMRVSQIVHNLVDNASKYTPNGGKIQISVHSAQEPAFIQITVSDNGIGIAPEDQEHIFQRFARIGNAELAHVTGTGLGLYITRSLVELHHGRIWLESAPGQGSTFHVLLPIAPPAAGTSST